MMLLILISILKADILLARVGGLPCSGTAVLIQGTTDVVL